MENKLEGKVAFVTRAGSGIGRATALAFAREGASVAVADISEQDNQETVRMIEEEGEQLGGRALAVKCDVSKVEDVRSALDKTIETFGRLDIAFNNAGIEYVIKPAAEVTEEEWEWILDIDLHGRLSLHEIRNPVDAQAGGRRHRQHLLWCRE